MRINNNLMAMNTHRQLGIANAAGSKSMEKLSSGFRINRAGDDAAGLAISEKMRAQIRGLNMASRNAQDGISLIQTAEGALSETHAILQRMKELATQSSNGTLDDDVDRAAIQDEINMLTEEIDRISTTASFNGIKLLDGSIGAGTSTATGYDQTLNIATTAKAVVTAIKGVGVADGMTVKSTDATDSKITFEVKDVDGNATTKVLDLADLITDKNTGGTFTPAGGAQGVLDLTSVGLGKIEFTATDASATAANLATDLNTFFTGEVTFATGTGAGGSLMLQVGDTNETAQKVSVDIGSMSSASLGVNGLDVSSQGASQTAIDTVNDAINKVSTQRAGLGAVQNRLEHTIKNLDTSSENLQASESRIRDVDMAKEMMEQTKQNILQQASTAMLAQANQAPQTVLQLLR